MSCIKCSCAHDSKWNNLVQKNNKLVKGNRRCLVSSTGLTNTLFYGDSLSVSYDIKCEPGAQFFGNLGLNSKNNLRALCRIKSAQNPVYAPVTKHASKNRPSACPLLDFFKSPFPSFNDCQTDLILLSA